MQSSNEFVVTTQIVHTAKYVTLSLLFGSSQQADPNAVWRFRAPCSVGTLVSLALLSNVAAGVIETPTACIEFMESFSKLSHIERVGYTRILKCERVLGNSAFKVHFSARGYAVTPKHYDIRKRAYLMSTAHIDDVFRFNEPGDISGQCTIGELVREACYVPAVLS